MHTRRHLLTATGASILLGACHAMPNPRVDSAVLHEALVFALKEEMCFWSLQGQKYGAVDGGLTHLWDIETVIAATAKRDADGVLSVRVFETFYVFDPQTGAPLEVLSNPFTGMDTSFPAYPARPVSQIYPSDQFRKTTETPVGEMTSDTLIHHRQSSQSVIQMDIEKSITLDRKGSTPLRIQEFLSYSAARSAFEPDYGFTEAAIELTIWSDWLPWMGMEDTPGGLFTRAEGRKKRSLAHVSQPVQTLLRQDYPALLDNAQEFLMTPWGGGEGGIRTLGTLARTTVFETAPFDRSGTSPCSR